MKSFWGSFSALHLRPRSQTWRSLCLLNEDWLLWPRITNLLKGHWPHSNCLATAPPLSLWFSPQCSCVFLKPALAPAHLQASFLHLVSINLSHSLHVIKHHIFSLLPEISMVTVGFAASITQVQAWNMISVLLSLRC